jgi:hypothetical protein
MNMTHTISPDFDEARPVATFRSDDVVWVKADKSFLISPLSDAMPIPSRIYEAQIALSEARSRPPILMEDEIDIRFNAPECAVKTVTLADGRIVSGSGKPWVHKWRAQKACKSLGITDFFWVNGVGNDGPNGRAWWLERKRTPGKLDLWRNADVMAINNDFRYVIERKSSISNEEWAGFVWEMRQCAKQWNARVFPKIEAVGFKSERDYVAFLIAWDDPSGKGVNV